MFMLVVDRKERKKLMVKHRKKKQYYKAMEPAEKYTLCFLAQFSQ